MKSPVTHGPCRVITSRRVAEIAALYRASFDIDVRDNFEGLDEVQICQCVETGYRFYYPHSIAGSPAYYDALYSQKENEGWSYKTDKWEFRRALELIRDPNADILDVGAGAGDFLAIAKEHAAFRTGLETNPFGVAEAERKNLTVLSRTIEDYSTENAERHDVVTAFQVLEHVPDVRSFITSCIRVLKPTGQLIIAVPNNDGFVGKQENLPLNMPPHHVGLWGRESLINIANAFGLDSARIEYEPLTNDNVGWYIAAMEDLNLPRSRIVRSLFYRLGFHNFFARYVRENRESIHGHTIMAIYRKPDSENC